MFTKAKLYLLLGAAFVCGLLGIYSRGVHQGVTQAQRDLDAQRLRNLQRKAKVKDDLDASDIARLAELSRKWVRTKDR